MAMVIELASKTGRSDSWALWIGPRFGQEAQDSFSMKVFGAELVMNQLL